MISGAAVIRGCVPRLRVPAEQKIAEKRAQVEADRSVERELRVDHAAVVFRDHHRSGMKIPVDQRLVLGEKFLAEACRCDFQGPIAAQVRDYVVELRRGVTVALADAVGVLKDQVHGDANQRLVSGEQCGSIHFVFERPREIGGEVAGACHILADVAGDLVVTPACNQTLSQDDMRR